MEDILDNEFAKRDIDFDRIRFGGKLAGKKWTLSQAEDRLGRTRKMIFLMAFIMLYPVWTNYIFHGLWYWDFFIERAVFSAILLLCGIFFPKNRLAAIIVALIPISLLVLSLILNGQIFPLGRFLFDIAIFLLMFVGIYNHFLAKRVKKELINEYMNGNPDATLEKIIP